MGRVLVDNVHVDGVLYAVGSTPTDPDVVSRIGAHCWREEVAGPGVGPAAVLPVFEQSFAVEEVGPSIFAATDGGAVDPVVVADPEPVVVAEVAAPTVVGSPPPLGGRGSGATAWLAYAEANQVDVNAKAERQEIIDAVVAAGLPTE